jgi:hypothetical protein
MLQWKMLLTSRETGMASTVYDCPASGEQNHNDDTASRFGIQGNLSDKWALFIKITQSGFERLKPQQAFDQAGDMPAARRL